MSDMGRNGQAVHRETIPGGWYWSVLLRRGFSLRITDPAGGANVGMLLYNPRNPLERYCVADTLKSQHTARLAGGNMLYSDMGRVMLSIVADSCGWHDTIGGVTTADAIRRKYGEAGYQAYRNAFHRSGRELFLIELGKWGLGPADLVPNVNLFSKVSVDGHGEMHFGDGNSRPGDVVELRAEMDVLVVLQTSQHPMDPAPAYDPKPVDLQVLRAPPASEDDVCRRLCPENERAWLNTAAYNCQG